MILDKILASSILIVSTMSLKPLRDLYTKSTETSSDFLAQTWQATQELNGEAVGAWLSMLGSAIYVSIFLES